MKRQYSLSITFYKDSYDFPISGGDTISKYYKPTIKKVVNALKSYHNKKDLHIIPNETFFGIKDIYERYKYFCDLESIINPYIDEVLYEFNTDEKEILYKILVKDNIN